MFYTIDPRGLVAGPDISFQISQNDFAKHLQTTVTSLRVIAEETGGSCACGTNDYQKFIQKIDNETSDYYVIGYVSNNPDPLKRTRRIQIKVLRPGAELLPYKDTYGIKR